MPAAGSSATGTSAAAWCASISTSSSTAVHARHALFSTLAIAFRLRARAHVGECAARRASTGLASARLPLPLRGRLLRLRVTRGLLSLCLVHTGRLLGRLLPLRLFTGSRLLPRALVLSAGLLPLRLRRISIVLPVLPRRIPIVLPVFPRIIAIVLPSLLVVGCLLRVRRAVVERTRTPVQSVGGRGSGHEPSRRDRGSSGSIVAGISRRRIRDGRRRLLLDHGRRLVLRNVDHILLGRNDLHDILLHCDDLLVIGFQIARRLCFAAENLDRLEHIRLLREHRLTERFGPIEVIAHEGHHLGIGEGD